jgi:hypothetical protein
MTSRPNTEYLDPLIGIPILLIGIFLTFYRYLIFDYYFSDGHIKLILFQVRTNIRFTFIPQNSEIIVGDTRHSRTFRTLNLMNRARYQTLLVDRKTSLLRYLVLTPRNHKQFVSDLKTYLDSDSL